VPPTSGIVAQLFGVRHLTTLFGISFLSHQLGGFFGSWLAGLIFDHTGSYDLVWMMAIALGVIAAALCLPIDERPANDKLQSA
jgi:predicted MFS family arabinose efflux permease